MAGALEAGGAACLANSTLLGSDFRIVACSMEATLGPTYSVNVLVTTSGFGMVEAAAANMALNCRDAGLGEEGSRRVEERRTKHNKVVCTIPD